MSRLANAWYQRAAWLYLLWPVAMLFRGLSFCRRKLQETDAAANKVPVVIVGNISVGGTGKTPIIMALSNHLKHHGIMPGVISRGYGGKSDSYPLAVTAQSDSDVVGDEPKLIATTCDIPVVVDPDRCRALNHLLTHHNVDVVLSDDGLQHYRLPRDYEIAVVDGKRLFGNTMTLPAGPLREPLSRLRTVNCVIVNGAQVDENAEAPIHPALAKAVHMGLSPSQLRNLDSGETRAFAGAPFQMGKRIQAVAAIGNPQRFFDLLEKLPYPIESFAFPDHQKISKDDLQKAGVDLSQPIVMTDKDAIKWPRGISGNCWALSVDVKLPKEFLQNFLEQVQSLIQQKKH